MSKSIPEIYGSLGFNDKVMREKLPKDIIMAGMYSIVRKCRNIFLKKLTRR